MIQRKMTINLRNLYVYRNMYFMPLSFLTEQFSKLSSIYFSSKNIGEVAPSYDRPIVQKLIPPLNLSLAIMSVAFVQYDYSISGPFIPRTRRSFSSFTRFPGYFLRCFA